MTEERQDDLQCPKCEEKLISKTTPSRPMPDVPESGDNVSSALGLAYCQSCDDTYPWYITEDGETRVGAAADTSLGRPTASGISATACSPSVLSKR